MPTPEENSASSLFCGEDAGEVVSSDLDSRIFGHPPPPQESQSRVLHPLLCDATAVGDLIDCESQTLPQGDYLHLCRGGSVNLTARQDSVSWILKVHAHYHFRPVTAVLAVNYFDRFLSAHSLPEKENGWPFQLLSVACLSLAAKMEELYAPPLLDLQICGPKFVFEPKTVQRMELQVMANLGWRLRSVTPFDFLHYFMPKILSLSSSAGPHPSSPSPIFSSASDLILRSSRVIDFLGYPPSAIAAAAVLLAAGVGSESHVAFDESVSKEMVTSCHQLMEENLVDTCPVAGVKAAEPEPPAELPRSPAGVLDAAACGTGSSDTRSENRGSSSVAEPSPPNKRLRSSVPDVQEP